MDTKGKSEKYPVRQHDTEDTRRGREVAIRVGLRNYLVGLVDPDTETMEDVERRVEIYDKLGKARRGDYRSKRELVKLAKDDFTLLDYIGKALIASGELPIVRELAANSHNE